MVTSSMSDELDVDAHEENRNVVLLISRKKMMNQKDWS